MRGCVCVFVCVCMCVCVLGYSFNALAVYNSAFAITFYLYQAPMSARCEKVGPFQVYLVHAHSPANSSGLLDFQEYDMSEHFKAPYELLIPQIFFLSFLTR